MVLDKVVKIISEQMNIAPEKISTSSDIQNDIGADSLDIVEMIMAVEEEWDLVVDDEDILDLKTVGDVVSYIQSHIE